MVIYSLLKFQGRPLVRRVKEGFVKLNVKWPSQRNRNDLPLLKEVLSKGGYMKPAPGPVSLERYGSIRIVISHGQAWVDVNFIH